MTDPRAEAERLVATLLGGASVAAESLKGFATGSAECCVCPLCKAIAAAREPSPDLAGRIADGAGEIAVGVANVLRAFTGGGQTGTPTTTTPTAEEPPPAGGDVWAAATRAQDSERSPEATPGRAEPAAPPTPPKPMAKKAVRPKAAPEGKPDGENE